MSFADAELGGRERMGITSRIRQWLIDLIREAVRQELQAQGDAVLVPRVPMSLYDVKNVPPAPPGTKSREIIYGTLVSFEQMQEEAIKAQEEEHAEKAR